MWICRRDHQLAVKTIFIAIILPNIFPQVRGNAYTVELIKSSPRNYLGHGAHWDSATQSVYYVDIDGNDTTILRYCPAEDRVYGATIDKTPLATFIIPVVGTANQFAIGMQNRLGIIEWDGQSPKATFVRSILKVEDCPKYAGNRFNDGKADPCGRLLAGTMRSDGCERLSIPTFGNLYRYSLNEAARRVNRPKTVRVSGGMAWNKEMSTFYYIDSCATDIKQYDYNLDTGDIYNQRSVFNFTVNGPSGGYTPDGMTIDSNGYLYVVAFGAGKILVINPQTGYVMKTIRLPVDQITSVTFGGTHLDELYVTSAYKGLITGQAAAAGQLFRVKRVAARGFDGVRVRV